MNVFVLCTGRCGSLTFINACKHIQNYTATHEKNVKNSGDSRLLYSPNHIEADNRLSWFLGRLEQVYGDDAIYVHLKRDTPGTARSFVKRWNTGIIHAYHTGIVMNSDTDGMSDDDRLSICTDYCHTINANIELFLKNKTKTMNFFLENAKNDFEKFWTLINAKGDFQKAVEEWNIAYNASEIKNESNMETIIRKENKWSENIEVGQKLFSDGKVEEAESVFNNTLNTEPDNLDAINYLGIIYYQKGDLEKSVAYFTRALKIDPYHKNSVLNICEVYKSINLLNVVRPFLLKIVERYPEDEKLLMLMKEVEKSDNDAAGSSMFAEKQNINTKEYWDKKFSDEINKSEWRSNVICFGKIKAALGVLGESGDTLLDVGCGYGMLLDMLAPIGFQLNGWDISGVAVNRIIEKGYSGRCLDFTAITPCAEDKVSHVVATELLEHVREPDNILQKMYQLAEKTIIISVPDNCLEDDEEHLQCFDEKQLRELIGQFSFNRVFIDSFVEEFLFAKPDGTTGLLQRPTLLAILEK